MLVVPLIPILQSMPMIFFYINVFGRLRSIRFHSPLIFPFLSHQIFSTKLTSSMSLPWFHFVLHIINHNVYWYTIISDPHWNSMIFDSVIHHWWYSLTILTSFNINVFLILHCNNYQRQHTQNEHFSDIQWISMAF